MTGEKHESIFLKAREDSCWLFEELSIDLNDITCTGHLEESFHLDDD